MPPRGLRRLRLPAPFGAAALWLALLLAPLSVNAEVRLEINGLNDEQEANVRALIGTLPRDQARAVRRFARDLDDQTRTALSALGYYAADIDVNTREEASADGVTDSNPDGMDAIIVIDATPNDPVKVQTLNVNITGPAREDKDFMAALAETPLKPGDIFLSADYESIKGNYVNAAQKLGYFDLDFPVSKVSVSRRTLSADITLEVASGPRYTFGKVVFDETAFSNEFLERWLTFAPGEPFDTNQVGELTSNLRNSGYFDGVRVIPQRDERYGKTVPIQVSMTKKDENLVGVGIGFATDVGPRFSLSWEKPLINRSGHSASVDLQLSEPRQSIGFEYKIPRKRQPLTNYYGIKAGLLNEDFDDDTPEYFKSTVAIQRVSRTKSDFEQSIFLRWERERSTISDVEDTVNLVLPGISYARSRAQGRPYTIWGQSESFSIYGGSDQALSSIDFFKTTFKFRYLRSFLGRKNTFIGSVGLGWIESNDFTRVPASQRFFAGGDRSVRGFKYRDISPIDLDGDPVGARYLEEFSVEYNRRIYDRWRWAVFVDAGRAFNTYDTGYSAGAGGGIRWESPVGPVRLDLATPISSGDGNDVRLHLSIGPDL